MTARSANAQSLTPGHFSTRSFRTISFGLMLIASSLVVTGCNGQAASADSEAYHHLAQVQRVQAQQQFTAQRRLPGVVLPRRSSELGFEVAGLITAISADEGDAVQRGDLLASLDTSLLETQRRALDAQREDLEARLQLNAKTLSRIEDLQGQNFAAAQRVDELIAEQQQLNAGLDRVNAEIAANQTRIEKSQILAPFSGRISRRLVDEGTVVNAGQPLLKLLQDGELEARINVPARFISQFSVGQAVELELAEQPLSGQVLSVGTDVERPTLTVPVRVSLAAQTALPGDLVYASSKENIATAGYWIPVSALRDGVRGLWQVYALRPEGDELHRIESRDVQVRFLEAQRAYVSGALDDGEQIVSAGLQRLVPGQVVRISESAP